MERKKVRQKVTSLTCDLDGTIEDAVKKLQEYAEMYPGAKVSYEDDSIPYDPNERMAFCIYVSRDETDEEMAKRVEQEAKWKAEQEASELRQYERLKARFGG
jgi:4-alpha-glucanotransferase